jgi:hypothetical protein
MDPDPEGPKTYGSGYATLVYFWQEYFREEWRGYGASVAEVFFKLKGEDRSVPYVGFPVAGSV